MAKGLIEKQDKAGFALVRGRMYEKWDSFRGENSLNAYSDSGYSVTRFLFDTLHATRTKIGDGVGMSGEVLWYGFADDSHIETALKAMWAQYVKSKK